MNGFVEPGTGRDKQWLQECCELVKAKMPANYTFVVFGFPISGTDRCYYASNATRESAAAPEKTVPRAARKLCHLSGDDSTL